MISNKYYIYCLIDPRNDIPFYIGKGKKQYNRKDRYLQHITCAKNGNKMCNAKKYNKICSILNEGFVDLKYEILFSTDDECLINEKEIFYISSYREKYNLSNIANGGSGGKTSIVSPLKGKTPSLETKNRMSIAKRGKPSNWKGKKFSKESLEKIKLARSKQTGLNEPRLIILTNSQEKHIVELRERGYGRRKISKATGIGAAVVVRFLKSINLWN